MDRNSVNENQTSRSATIEKLAASEADDGQSGLLPCPFCEFPASLSDVFNEDGYWAAYCPKCKSGTASFPQKIGAIKAWNTRTNSDEYESLKAVVSDPQRWMRWCDSRVLEENEALIKVLHEYRGQHDVLWRQGAIDRTTECPCGRCVHARTALAPKPDTGVVARYIDPNTEQEMLWQKAGLCVWCGSKSRVSGKCFCRYCDSCSRCWVSATLADYKDEDYGPVSRWEVCPECQEVQ